MSLPSTIKHPSTFLKSPSAGFDGAFDWSWTNGHLGDKKITPMDFDGVVERKGNFLVMETKGVGVPVPRGQMYTLESAYRIGVFTVLFIQGKSSPESLMAWCAPGFANGKRMGAHHPCSASRAGAFVGRWYEFADQNPSAQSSSNALSVIHDIKEQLRESRAISALMLREYLIEKSGRFQDNGWSTREADKEAATMASAKFGVDFDMCLGILLNTP
jgi:hypothetical protein